MTIAGFFVLVFAESFAVVVARIAHGVPFEELIKTRFISAIEDYQPSGKSMIECNLGIRDRSPLSRSEVQMQPYSHRERFELTSVSTSNFLRYAQYHVPVTAFIGVPLKSDATSYIA
jgi:hypothetical protein